MADTADQQLASAASALTLQNLDRLPPAAERGKGGNDTNRSTCSTTRSQYARKDPNKRVAGSLSVDQEEVLIGLMFDDFQRTGCKSLDYDRVVRCAVTIQTDEDVCRVLNAEPVSLDDAWVPEDDWITDMCFAFCSTEGQLTARSYPNGEISQPHMVALVERGTAKRATREGQIPRKKKGAAGSKAGKPPVAKSTKTSAAAAASDASLLADPRPKPTGNKGRKLSPKASPKP